ncbi:MAG: TRAM domain-containing protein [Nitrososphaeraceae archaeon]|jgi:predicted RNA-binding protein with TRAM domain
MSYGQSTSGYSGRTTSNFSRPVETGKEYTVDVTDKGREGDGIAKVDGLVIFIKNAKKGDKNIKIKIISVGSRFATAEVVAGSTDAT